ncbi:cbh2 [Symbiodinium sp. CCMP2592]|nr:cbh2 [Symbiodinium sp. CCMP2592]
MYQAAWFFSGAWLQNKCSTCQLPQLRRATDERNACRLFVRLLGASIPGLAEPGLLMREHPCVEVAFGDTVKESEPAEYVSVGTPTFGPSARKPGLVPTALQDCEWHFGDTMVFTVQLSELTSCGLSLRVHTRSDMRLGPLQLDLARPSQVGCCTLDMRRRILPACSNPKVAQVASKGAKDEAHAASQEIWESEQICLPLVTADGADEGAWLLVSFALSANPASLEKLASRADRTLVERVSESVSHLGQQAQPALQWAAECCATETARSSQERIVVSIPAMEHENAGSVDLGRSQTGAPENRPSRECAAAPQQEIEAEPAPEPPAFPETVQSRLPVRSQCGRYLVSQTPAGAAPGPALPMPYTLNPAWAWYQRPQLTQSANGLQPQTWAFPQLLSCMQVARGQQLTAVWSLLQTSLRATAPWSKINLWIWWHKAISEAPVQLPELNTQDLSNTAQAAPLPLFWHLGPARAASLIKLASFRREETEMLLWSLAPWCWETSLKVLRDMDRTSRLRALGQPG